MHRYRHGRRRLRKRTHNRRNLLEVVKGALPCVACSLKTGRATEYRTGYSRLGGTLKEKSYLPGKLYENYRHMLVSSLDLVTALCTVDQ